MTSVKWKPGTHLLPVKPRKIDLLFRSLRLTSRPLAHTHTHIHTHTSAALNLTPASTHTPVCHRCRFVFCLPVSGFSQPDAPALWLTPGSWLTLALCQLPPRSPLWNKGTPAILGRPGQRWGQLSAQVSFIRHSAAKTLYYFLFFYKRCVLGYAFVVRYLKWFCYPSLWSGNKEKTMSFDLKFCKNFIRSPDWLVSDTSCGSFPSSDTMGRYTLYVCHTYFCLKLSAFETDLAISFLR